MESGGIPFYLESGHRASIERCAHNTSWNLRGYCRDCMETVFPVMGRIGWDGNSNNGTIATSSAGGIPLIFQFGDGPYSRNYGYVNVPHIKKFRSVLSKSELDRVTTTTTTDELIEEHDSCVSHSRKIPMPIGELQPIVWKLNTERHYGRVEEVALLDRTPWQDKMDKVVFRGAMTGDHRANATDEEEICRSNQRCRLVYRYAHSHLVDARLTGRLAPETVNGVTVKAERMPLRDMLKYKAIVILEGNDVSSGLKWALRSRSVVLKTKPTLTSWAMEERLEPWVHYIPIRSDLSDVEEKMQWVLEHDRESRAIAIRGALWIYDLLFHPDAEEENRWINEEILRRYRALFVEKG